jgi:hypothetical protein
MTTTQDIEAAIAEIRAARKPNLSQIAGKYGIKRTRLGRLAKGTTTRSKTPKAGGKAAHFSFDRLSDSFENDSLAI